MFSVSFVEKIILILNCLVIFVKNQLGIYWNLCSVPLILGTSVLYLYHIVSLM